jgi:hypothetical protein
MVGLNTIIKDKTIDLSHAWKLTYTAEESGWEKKEGIFLV